MENNRELVHHLIRSGVLKTPILIDAFSRCDRIGFVPEVLAESAYEDIPLPIGEGQTISQPTTVAIMFELLQPKSGNTILDIGSGSGWTTALLAFVSGNEGKVEGIERIEALVNYGNGNLSKTGVSNASIEHADPHALGKPGREYDRILVSASAYKMPEELFLQLKPGGILVIPVRESLWRVHKDEGGKLRFYELPGFRFVPLIFP